MVYKQSSAQRVVQVILGTGSVFLGLHLVLSEWTSFNRILLGLFGALLASIGLLIIYLGQSD